MLTGTQVLLLVVSETGLVYTFTTPKLQPLVTKAEGKNLIQVRRCAGAIAMEMEDFIHKGTGLEARMASVHTMLGSQCTDQTIVLCAHHAGLLLSHRHPHAGILTQWQDGVLVCTISVRHTAHMHPRLLDAHLHPLDAPTSILRSVSAVSVVSAFPI